MLNTKKHPLKFKHLILFLLIGITFNSYSQWNNSVMNLPKYDQKPYHFGFSLGFNKFDFSIKNVKGFNQMDSIQVLQSTPQFGFNINIVTNLKLNDYLDLRFIPGLSFGSRTLEYSLIVNNDKLIHISKLIESSIIEFPLSIKFKSARYENGRAYVLGGIKYALDMASQAGKTDSNPEDKIIKLKRNDLCYEMGFGLDFYFEYFKFSPEIKFSMGLNDMLKRENDVYTNSISRLNSKVLFISFLFE